MWWNSNDYQGFRNDPEKDGIVKKYREEVASNTDTVVVARRKFQCRQHAGPFQQCAAHTVTDTPVEEQRDATPMPETSVTKPLDSTPAEVNGAGQSEGTTVKKRAKTAPD